MDYKQNEILGHMGRKMKTLNDEMDVNQANLHKATLYRLNKHMNTYLCLRCNIYGHFNIHPDYDIATCYLCKTSYTADFMTHYIKNIKKVHRMMPWLRPEEISRFKIGQAFLKQKIK